MAGTQQANRAVAAADDRQATLKPSGPPVQVHDDAEARCVGDLGPVQVQPQLTGAARDDVVDGIANIGNRVDIKATFDHDVVTIKGRVHPNRAGRQRCGAAWVLGHDGLP